LVNTFGDLLKHSFFLVIPKQQNNPQRLREFEEKILQQWISELPVANLGLATRLIYDFILEFNALAMPSQLRFDTLELLRPSLLMVEEYLRSKLTKNLFPKDENDQKVLKLLVALQRQFTIGYWIVVKELTENESRWFKSKNAAISIQRTIKGLGNIIVSYLIMGMRVPDWVWIDLHALYILSVKTKKNAIQVVNWDNNAIKKTSSPEECYLQILLLSLADSSGMLQKEIVMVHRFIETVCPLVRISTSPVLMGEYECIIVTEEDDPPYFRHINDGKEIAPSLRKDMPAVLYLDFRILNKALLDKKIAVDENLSRFTAINRDDTKEAMTETLLAYLQRRWFGKALESDFLFSDRLDRFVAIGLVASVKLQTSQEKAAEDQEFLVNSVSSQLLSGLFKANVMSIGSLISFRKVDMPPHKRTLGVVNRLIVEKDSGRISFGLRMLTDKVMPVRYLKNDGQLSDVPKNALLYKLEDEIDKNFIIMDTFIFKDGDSIQLYVNQDQFPIVLKNRKNIALGYWQFECLRIPERNY